MRPSRPALTVAATLTLALLAGCGSSSSPSPGGTTAATAAAPSVALKGVTATGAVDLKTAPKVALGTTPISTTAVERKVLTPGTGTAATTQDTVRLRAQIFNGTSGKLLDDGYAEGRQPEGYRLGRADLIAGFTEGLLGATKGSRVVFSIPPAKGFGAEGNSQLGIAGTDTIVVVADIADVRRGLTQVDGAQAASPAGLPTVTVGSFVGPFGNATAGRPAGLAAWVPSTWARPRRTSAMSATTTMVSVPAMPSWLLPSAPKPLAGGMEKTTREPFAAPSSPSVKPAMRSARPRR